MIGVLLGIALLFLSIFSSITLSTSTAQLVGRYKLQQLVNHELRREVDQLALGTVSSYSFEELSALQDSSGYVDSTSLKGPAKEEVLTLEGHNYIVERTIQLKRWKESHRSADYVLVKVSLYEEKESQKGNILGAKTKVITN